MLESEMSAPKIAGTQRHRVNNEATNALDYYRSNYSVKFVDHLLSEFNGRFCDDNQVGFRLFKILTAHFHAKEDLVNFDEIVSDLLYWESDLLYPTSLKNEVKVWYDRWKSAPACDVPTNLLDTLSQCDWDVYPCIHQLLLIGCTPPVTSCEAELTMHESFTFVYGRRRTCLIDSYEHA